MHLIKAVMPTAIIKRVPQTLNGTLMDGRTIWLTRMHFACSYPLLTWMMRLVTLNFGRHHIKAKALLALVPLLRLQSPRGTVNAKQVMQFGMIIVRCTEEYKTVAQNCDLLCKYSSKENGIKKQGTTELLQ